MQYLKKMLALGGSCFLCMISIAGAQEEIIADHTITGIRRIENIPLEWIHKARDSLKIFYHGTSHSAQVRCGLLYVNSEYGENYAYHRPRRNPVDKEDTLLFFHDLPRSISCARDLGLGDNEWWTCTRAVLDSFPIINVAFWSWCGGAGRASEEQIATYLAQGDAIEKDYPGVRFVYMTGHTDGSGYVDRKDSTKVPPLHRNNELIREYCRANNKILFDFGDIESHSPDGRDMMALYNNQHKYDIDGDTRADEGTNWCDEYCQIDHDGCYSLKYDDYCGHTHPLVSQLKGEAVWWMMARMVGWQGFDETGAATPHEGAKGSPLKQMSISRNRNAVHYDLRGRLMGAAKNCRAKAQGIPTLIMAKTENGVYPVVQDLER